VISWILAGLKDCFAQECLVLRPTYSCNLVTGVTSPQKALLSHTVARYPTVMARRIDLTYAMRMQLGEEAFRKAIAKQFFGEAKAA